VQYKDVWPKKIAKSKWLTNWLRSTVYIGAKSSLVQYSFSPNIKKHHCGKKQQKNVTFRRSLTGLSVFLRNAIAIIYSRGALQPPGIRRFGNRVSQLSPLWPVLGNGDSLLSHRIPSRCPYFWARSPTSCPKSSVDNQAVENAIPNHLVNYLYPSFLKRFNRACALGFALSLSLFKRRWKKYTV